MTDPYSQFALLAIELQIALNQKGKYAIKGGHRVVLSLSECLEIIWKVKKSLEKKETI